MSRSERVLADVVMASDVAPRLRVMLETVVVAAIILYLVFLAVAQRDPITARAQVVEAFTAWLPLRAELVAWRAESGRWPTSAEEFDSEALLRDNQDAVARRIELSEGGTVTVLFGNEAPIEGLKGRRLSFRPALPTTDPGLPMIWFCGTRSMPDGFAPSGEDRSDLAPAYLPSSCKEFPRP